MNSESRRLAEILAFVVLQAVLFVGGLVTGFDPSDPSLLAALWSAVSHASWFHLVTNMMVFVPVAVALLSERDWPVVWPTFVLAVVTNVFAAFVQSGAVAGASGGIIALAAMWHPLLGWFFVLTGGFGSGVAWSAHVLGAVIGTVIFVRSHDVV